MMKDESGFFPTIGKELPASGTGGLIRGMLDKNERAVVFESLC
jgi:hypothetical protein